LPLPAIGAMEMPNALSAREPQMMDFRDLFQWDRFITPTIVKTFHWLLVMLLVLFGLSGVFFGLTTMAVSPFGGFLIVLTSIFGVIVGVVFSRMLAEFCLMIFRISEHLDAIRNQGARD
jgi:Domain of unknown function (DUF4282)